MSRLFDFKLEKKRAIEESRREAHNFVHRHEDLILGASAHEIDLAVEQIADALSELRIAKLDEEIAKRKQLG